MDEKDSTKLEPVESVPFPSVTVVRPRPENVPFGWMVFNAPRPLYGDLDWTGEFLTGVFYVAVDPNGPRAGDMISRNRSLDARLLKYISREEWDSRVDAYGKRMVERYGVDLADFSRRDVESSYHGWLRNHGEHVVMPAREG